MTQDQNLAIEVTSEKTKAELTMSNEKQHWEKCDFSDFKNVIWLILFMLFFCMLFEKPFIT